ncbi:hypothetical protein HZ326_31589, partial [Fusarium oxysporum f. sp. albedinis]
MCCIPFEIFSVSPHPAHPPSFTPVGISPNLLMELLP